LLVRGLWVTLSLAVGVGGCTPDPEVTKRHATEHAEFLAVAATRDVEEVRGAMPQGVEYLAPLWAKEQDPAKEPEAARDALNRARHTVQDLRNVKSTFFALVSKDGTIIRNDLEEDMMAGRNLFESFAELKKASAGKYVETVGSMHEARGVEGKPDGQWVAAQPIEAGGGVVGLYVTGWTWAQYCYRLEAALKSHLQDLDRNDKPLFYTFVVVGKQAFGTRVSPLINAEAIEKVDPMSQLDAQGQYATTLEITGRTFALAVVRVPALGAEVGVAVLRSET
jgi:hypothetical protein